MTSVCHVDQDHWHLLFSTKFNTLRSVDHYLDVIMGAMASQITNLPIVYSKNYSGADQRKHQSSASLAFVRGILRRPVNSPHKWPVTRKMFPFHDVTMHADQAHSRLLFFTKFNTLRSVEISIEIHTFQAINRISRRLWNLVILFKRQCVKSTWSMEHYVMNIFYHVHNI